MRILHVISTLDPTNGGPSRAVLDMATASARQGHHVRVFSTEYGGETVDTSNAVSAGVNIQRFPLAFPNIIHRSSALKEALMREVPRADVVHLHSLYLYHSWATWQACKASGVPYVLRPHGTLDPYVYNRHRFRKWLFEQAFQNRVTAGATFIHYTAEDERQLAQPYVHGVPGWVTPLPVAVEEFADLPPASAFRDAWPEVGDRRIVLFYSRLNFKKGLDLLVEAFAQVAKGRDDLCLVFAGPDGGMLNQVKQWVRERELSDKTLFTGMLRGPEALAALSAAEVMALPSYSENFGRVVAEAMAAGRPVLISDKVNIWREVENAGAGIVVPTEAAAVAEGLATLLADREKAQTMGQAGRRLVTEKFSPAGVADELLKMYVAAAQKADIKSA